MACSRKCGQPTAETDLRTCLPESEPEHFRPWKKSNDSNRYSFQNKNKGIVSVMDCSWNGILIFYLEPGLSVSQCEAVSLWKQKLWGLMLSEEEFDQHAHNWTCFSTLNLSLECVLQDCCSGWNQCAGDHQLPLQTLGRCVLPWACACISTPQRDPRNHVPLLEVQPGFKSICGWWWSALIPWQSGDGTFKDQAQA